MTARLKSLKVTDFRSIFGTVDVSLDAQTVLIHGPNGTGKTSLLSAIELGLTRSIMSFARFDGDYVQHLPHKDAKGLGRVDLTVGGLAAKDATGRIEVSATEIQGAPLLDTLPARFFSERCYLAQSTLGRLLEIYEHQDTRKSDSALTRFVKELMGLENLEAVIDGLHAAGDVRRLRGFTPLFWAAREQGPKWDAELVKANEAIANERARLGIAEANLSAALGLVPDQLASASTGEVRNDIQARRARNEERMQGLARRRRDLGGAASQILDATAEPGPTVPIAGAVQADDRAAYDAWQSGPGAELDAVVAQVQGSFPDVPPVLANPARAQSRALAAIKAEFDRLTALMAEDAASTRQLETLGTSITQAKARLVAIDLELGAKKGASQDLAKALSAVSEFIEGEDCPVCGRDFSEVSDTPLASHISEEVSRLISAAGRVQELVSDRSTTASLLAKAEAQAADLRAKQLPPERRASVQQTLAQLTEWRNALNTLHATAQDGTRLQMYAAAVAQRQAVLSTRQTAISGLRDQMNAYALELGMDPSPVETPLGMVVERLIAEVSRQEQAAYEVDDQVRAALATLEEMDGARRALDAATADHLRLTVLTEDLAERRTEADRRIGLARDLAGRAQALRTTKVRQVFNDELNALWRELFIRLAPDEAFVPAFALPSRANGAVEAILETHYRSGGKGGNPRSMLSAGNLNTAALTLFLSLHLSVKPILPWLIIDDPVQSMDDVHIAQFAALLRTLKMDGRQVILAVHDRQLFDYLALEMSPSSNGDRLITIELGRGADSRTTAPWKLTAYEPDTAIAA